MKYFYWIRLLFKRWVSKHKIIIEYCHSCGVKQPLVWHCSDKLWIKVTGLTNGNGILCPKCFQKRADNLGIFIMWSPKESL